MEDLKAYVDGELSPEKTELIRAQIAVDPELAEEVAFMRLIGQEFGAMAKEHAVVGGEATMAAVRKGQRFSFSRLPGWALGLILFVVVVPGAVFTVFPVFAKAKASAKRSMDPDLGTARLASSRSDRASRMLNTPATAGISAAEESRRAASPKALSDETVSPLKEGPSSGRQWHATLIAPDYRRRGASVDNRIASGPSEGAAASPSDDVLLAKKPLSKNLIPVDNRMVVQDGQIEVVVPDVSAAQSQAMSYAKSLGGFVQASSLDRDANNLPVASLTLRVPARLFASVMDHLKTLSKDEEVKSDHVTGEDVTGKYADTTARLRVLRAEEDSYVTMLHAARRIGDLLEIKDRLTQVREQIAMSTIEVTIDQKAKAGTPEPAKGWTDDSWAASLNALSAAGRFLASASIFVFVLSPLWVPVVLIGWFLARRNR